MSGLELAWKIKRLGSAPAVVFATRCPKSAADAFDLGAVDYVCKPLQAERLAESLRPVAAARLVASLAHRSAPIGSEPTGGGLSGGGPTERSGATVPAPAPGPAEALDLIEVPDVMPVEQGTTTKLVPRSWVRWAHAQGDYAWLFTPDGSHLIRAKLAALADCWRSAGLVRIHRSYLVQLRFVTAVQQRAKQLSVIVDGQQLPVSRRLAPVVRRTAAPRRALEVGCVTPCL
jgi:DNA-binding LytR/AlgR family response regulator